MAELNMQAPMGPCEALIRARNLVAHPDMMFGEVEGRRIIAGLLEALDKWPVVAKAIESSAEIFPLASWDMAAPEAIVEWCNAARRHGARPEKIAEAMGIATHWDTRGDRRWPT